MTRRTWSGFWSELLCLVVAWPSACPAAERHVATDAELRQALPTLRPGDVLLVAQGAYNGGLYVEDLRGEDGRPIVIAAADPARPPTFRGGGNGLHLVRPTHVELRDLVFEGATGNGLNLDDGGGRDGSAHHLVLRRLHVSDVGPEGNCDGIKVSGLDDFRIEECTVERWGSGGSAIDMVGCHRGLITGCLFRYRGDLAANGVQTKGGSSDVTIRRNRFEQAGSRAINLGGSTGLQFFRPPLEQDAGGSHAEARRITVEGNVFIGSAAPVAFVGCDGSVVRFNTIYRPGRWCLRILQETNEAGFVPCRNGEFSDNLVVFRAGELATAVNIGPNTAPGTFRFERNAWFCEDRPERSHPDLPAAETVGVYGQDPLFRDADRGDLRLQEGSPLAGKGADALPQD
ncbi:MAG: right-handed parallel beta-helix repeat-containing protein [Armatimonadetes bacterium]|nr:right-handed parallel beta-helix repeat-containing protein [Armatimonadota bacterium]